MMEIENKITLPEIVRCIRKRRKFIIAVSSVILLIGFLYCLFATKIYKAQALLLPVGGNYDGSLIGSMGNSIGSMLLGGLSQYSNAAPLIAALNSRTIGEQVINQLDLMPFFFEDDWNAKKKQWEGPKTAHPTMEDAFELMRDNIINIKEDTEYGTILIEAETRQPTLSANIVNQFINELTKYLLGTELTGAKRNRIFVEKQLEDNKILLLQTGKELSEFYTMNNISNLDPRIDVDVSIYHSQPNQASSIYNGVELSGLAVKKDHLQNQLEQARLVRDIPQQVYLEFLKAYSDVLKGINILLSQEYEMAKIKEAKEDISFQVIDWARIPINEHKPRPLLIMALALLSALMISILLALSFEHIGRLRERVCE